MKRKQSLLTAGCWSCAGAWPQNMCSTSTTSQTLQLFHWQVNQLSLFANCMRRLVQGNQALLIIRQVLALVELWEFELPSVFHFFNGMILLSPTQLPSRLITKRFNRHIQGGTYSLISAGNIFVYICPYCFYLIMGWFRQQFCIDFAGSTWNLTVQNGH